MTTIKNLNMVGLKHLSKNERYQKHFSTNRHLRIITMVIICVCALQCSQPLAAMTETLAAAPTTEDCSVSVTCTQCAARSSCSWSLRRQYCAGSLEIRDSSHQLVVHESSGCPRYSLVSRFMGRSDASYAYAIRLDAASAGFTKFLGQTGAAGIECEVAGVSTRGRVSGDTIECDAVRPAANGVRREGDVHVHMARITFAGGVALRLDNVADGYFAVQVSERRECGRDSWHERCVTCTRNDASGTDYLVRCSGRNACTGLFEYRDTRRSGDREDAALSCGPDVGVRSIEPASARWTGDTELRVTVSDRGILAEKTAISVRVGGRECANARVIDDSRAAKDNCTVIACVVPRADANLPKTAVVQVLYALDRTLTLEAVMPFLYDYPVIWAVERVEHYGGGGTDGWAAGKRTATEWIVAGTLLDAGERARVSVGAADVACHVTNQTHDRIACTVAVENGTACSTANGLLTVDFDGGALKVYVVTDPWAVYVGEPLLDAGQSFRAMAAGGSELFVRGKRFLHVSRATFYATGNDGVPRHGNCHVVNDTYASCVAPPLDTVTPPPTDFGLLVDFAGRRAVRLPVAESSYTAYTDPVYTDFETDATSGIVTVHGGGGPGGGVAYSKRDVTVRLSNIDGGDGVCQVLAVYPDRIVCASSSSPQVVLDRVRVIVVTICDRLQLIVTKRAVRKPRGQWSGAIFRWTALLASTVGLVGLGVLICGLRVAAKRRRRASDYRVPNASECSDPMMGPLPGPD